MTPTEQEGTVAVDAAARTAWDLQRKAAEAAGVPTAGPWENLGPLDQNYYREAVLPLVWAALEALPDRRESVLEQVRIEWENGNITESALDRIEA